MQINNLLRILAVALERKQDALFSYDVKKQSKYITQLGIPRDDVERAFFQYKCQMQFNGKVISFLLNVASLPIILFYLLYYKKQKLITTSVKDAVFFRDGKPENILPASLQIEFTDIEKNPDEGIQLTYQDKKIVKTLFSRYPLSWHFILKCTIKIGRYSYVIEKYKPKAIIVCAEYSFTSSVLTFYCHQKGIEHINVMHGEKMYYMRDAFFKFDRCFVWDEYYVKLLIELSADENQFIVEVPPSLKFNNTITKTHEYDYTYYLGAESMDVLYKIANIMQFLKNMGCKVTIRPHPRYTDVKQLEKIFINVDIEDVKSISIEKSLMRTENAVSLYSTVLNQALYNSVPIVIDDVSNPKNYYKLKELKYKCLETNSKLLSHVLKFN